MSVRTQNIADETVGTIAAGLAGATMVFRKYKIDFCCGGDVRLSEACAKRAVATETVLAELTALEARQPDVPDETPAMIEHIVQRFHDVHRQELPELIKLARKVETVHRDHPDAPHGLADVLEETLASLTSHMMKEEQILFPCMLSGHVPAGPISMMRYEHDEEARHIRALQTLTHSYTPPADGCNSWRALYTGVEKFVTDLMEHIHLENNVLFVRFE